MQYEPESEWLRQNATWDHIPKVYVDLGAAHPINKSLTSICRENGWRGLAIDGNQDYANDWAAAGYGHHFVCAVLSDQPTARFVVHENSFTSRISDFPEDDHPEKWGIKRIEERSTVSLNHLLDVHDIGRIDLLTVDLEGMEARILKTLNFEKYTPAWIISEFNTQGEGVDPEVCNFVLSQGYELVHMTQSNLIFRKK